MNKITIENMKDYLGNCRNKENDSHTDLYLCVIVSYLNLLLNHIDRDTF